MPRIAWVAGIAAAAGVAFAACLLGGWGGESTVADRRCPRLAGLRGVRRRLFGVSRAVGSRSAAQCVDLPDHRALRMGSRRGDLGLLPARARHGTVSVPIGGGRRLSDLPGRRLPGAGVVSRRVFVPVSNPSRARRADRRRRVVRGVLGDRPTKRVRRGRRGPVRGGGFVGVSRDRHRGSRSGAAGSGPGPYQSTRDADVADRRKHVERVVGQRLRQPGCPRRLLQWRSHRHWLGRGVADAEHGCAGRSPCATYRRAEGAGAIAGVDVVGIPATCAGNRGVRPAIPSNAGIGHRPRSVDPGGGRRAGPAIHHGWRKPAAAGTGGRSGVA